MLLTNCANKQYETPSPVSFLPINQSITQLKSSIDSNETKSQILLHLGQVQLRVEETESRYRQQYGQLEKVTKDYSELQDEHIVLQTKYDVLNSESWKTKLIAVIWSVLFGFACGFFFTPLLTFGCRMLGLIIKL